MLLTFFLVVFGWIIFRADSIGQAWDYLRCMCDRSLFSAPDAPGVTGVTLGIVIMLVAEWLQRKREQALDLTAVKPAVVRYAIYLSVLFLTFAFGGHTENFIYFQF